jgi:uncharacterized protein YjiS (DUF1127 family)
MTLSITNNKFDITLFKKPLNLYLYIPPSSAHLPGMATGLVFGMVLRIMKLCSRVSDAQRQICVFYRQLLRRGYSKDHLTMLFTNAFENAYQHYRRTRAELKALEDQKLVQGYSRVFFHLQYHPMTQIPKSFNVSGKNK